MTGWAGTEEERRPGSSAFGALLAELSRDQARRAREFERIVRWFLLNDARYRHELRAVWLWRDWPAQWGPDAGIDLVAETNRGELWAVQAKLYSPNYAIKKADLDSFLSESSRQRFSYRLLVATTDRLGPLAQRTIQAQRVPVGTQLRSDLERAEVAWPAHPDELRPAASLRKQPRPHQQDAVDAVCRGFAQHGRGKLIMACGTGKTLVALWLAERLGAERVLVLVPSLSLLAQTLREWTMNSARPFRYLAVCSDETVEAQDAPVEHTSELGIPVTTKPEEIAGFLRLPGTRVVFATYQSSPAIRDALHHGVDAFDLAIADEAHRCAGRVSNEFALILNDAAIGARRRLFMTATPRYFTGHLRREAEDADFEIASMDDEEQFGPEFHRLSFGEAIARGLLSDYQVVVAGIESEEYRRYAERATLVTVDGQRATDARTLAGQIVLLKAMRTYDLRRMVSFHSRVAAARHFSDSLRTVREWMHEGDRPSGELWAEHVSGAMPSGRRHVLLERLRHLTSNERALLANARCLSEGVDVPALDGVAFIDPRRSVVDIAQAVGRAIRRSEEKKIASVVLPVFIDSSADPAAQLEGSAFAPVWEVVRALRAHDEQIAEELDSIRFGLGRRAAGALRLPSKLRLDLPTRLGAAFAELLTLHIVEETTSSWEFWLGLLEGYVEREGTASVPGPHLEHGYRLGRWVLHQRAARTSLTEERRRRLECLSGWTWNAHDTAWEEGYQHLVRFVEHAGKADAPLSFVDAAGYKLGQWINMQRSRYRRGTLEPDRSSRLASLPAWTWDAREAAWEEGCERLRRFVARSGHARVPHGHLDDAGFPLGRWVSAQRSFHRAGKLEPDRVRQLAALPAWTWHAQESKWEDGYRHLLRYVERTGIAEVPGTYVDDDGYRLGSWVVVQRHKEAVLTEERRRLLQALPGWTGSALDAAWEKGYQHLLRFTERARPSRVPQEYVDTDGYALGRWIDAQLSAYRRGQLAPDRVQRLAAVPGWVWQPREARWSEGHAHLVRYVERTGTSQVPWGFADADGFELARWIARIRAYYLRGELPPDRVEQLSVLPGWSWSAHDARWEAGFERLCRYVGQKGELSGMRKGYREEDGYALGSWVWQQRRLFARGRLPPARAERLATIRAWRW